MGTNNSNILNENVDASSTRYGLAYNSTTERTVNASAINNQLENQLNREFRYEASPNSSRGRNSTRNRQRFQRNSLNSSLDRDPPCNQIELTCILYPKMINQTKI